MMKTRKQRIDHHLALSSSLALMSDSRLSSAIQSTQSRAGCGQTNIVGIGNSKVFAKRIPLTALELTNAYSTRNLYRIPTFYNYGIGSAGFGAFRELAAHVKTTNWVLEGTVSSFPLLHHHRIIRRLGGNPPGQREALKKYVRYWNNSKGVARYLEQRVRARHELVLVLEYIETSLVSWLQRNPDGVARERALNSTLDTIRFLHDHRMIHFDAHTLNLRTDGRTFYLCDFGLVLDADFELTPTERRFFGRHRYYDFAQAISGIGRNLVDLYSALDDAAKSSVHERLGATPDDFQSFLDKLMTNAEQLAQARLLHADARFLQLLARYRPIIGAMNRFKCELQQSPRRNTPFPHRKLTGLLHRSGVI